MLAHGLEILSGAIPRTSGVATLMEIPTIEHFLFVAHLAHHFLRAPDDFFFAAIFASRMVSWTDYAQNLVGVIHTVTTFVEHFPPEIRVLWIVKVPFFVLHSPHNVFFLWVQPKQVVVELEFVRGLLD